MNAQHYPSISSLYRVADGPNTARYRFIKNASWVSSVANFITAYEESQ